MASEEAQAKDLEAMMATPGWGILVELAEELRLDWCNDLVEQDNPDTRAKIKALDAFLGNPSLIVEEYRNNRKS